MTNNAITTELKDLFIEIVAKSESFSDEEVDDIEILLEKNRFCEIGEWIIHIDNYTLEKSFDALVMRDKIGLEYYLNGLKGFYD